MSRKKSSFAGKQAIMQVQISPRADEKNLIDFFCTITQLNILTTFAVKVVVGCNNNVGGFHENLVTIRDL